MLAWCDPLLKSVGLSILIGYYLVIRYPFFPPALFTLDELLVYDEATTTPRIKCNQEKLPFCLLANDSTTENPLSAERAKELEEAARNDDQKMITDYIRSIYFDRIRQKYNATSKCAPKVVFFSCNGAKMGRSHCNCGCAGLGDRLRGVVAVFYMALLADVTFAMDWTHPHSLEEHFKINHQMYGISPDNLTSEMSDFNNFIYWNWVQDEGSAQSVTGNKQFGYLDTLRNPNVHGITIALNSLVPMGIMLSLPGTVIDAYHLQPLNYMQLASASLRIVFGNPKPAVKFLTEQLWNVTVGKDPKCVGQTIGLQIRLNRPGWSEPLRVLPNQTSCFREELKRLIQDKGLTNPAVFVTGDDVPAIADFVMRLNNEGIQAYRSPDRIEHHIDSSYTGSNYQRRWHLTATTYRDWLMLTRADYLIISRSSFAETASIFSRKPTRRFQHKVTNSCLFDDYNQLKSLFMEGF